MKKHQSSIDGFVAKTPRRNLGDVHETSLPSVGQSNRPAVSESQGREMSATRQSVRRMDIDESLRNIGDDVERPKQKRRLGILRRRNKKPLSRRQKITRRIVGVIIILVLAMFVFIGIKALIKGMGVFNGNLFGFFMSKPLKMDANGRTNILVLGSTDDDPNHPGNDLTDTMMIVSLDQNKKNAYMFSIPRDLWVEYGKACDSGYQGKINVAFSCQNSGKDTKAEQDRMTKTQKFVGSIVGLDVQYTVHVNSVVVRDAVNAVGGIDVDIQGSGGAPGIMDRNFDGQCAFKCYWVKYSNGVHHLDGQHAMYLSMARGDDGYAAQIYGTYGLGRSNFDREVNQQKVMLALQKKATSGGVLANPTAISSLLDAVGDNLRTNFESSELQTLMKLGREIPANKIQRLSLIDGDNPVVTTGMVDGQSVVEPTAGLYDYTGIQAFIKRQILMGDVIREKASIAVYNATDTYGVARQKANDLTAEGYNITTTDNAPTTDYTGTTLYVLTKKKPATQKKLEALYGVVAKENPPFSAPSGTDFMIIFGKNTSN